MDDLPDGIYFGLDFDSYKAIRRLSPTGAKQLRISAATFWADSWMNPHPKVLTEEQQRRKELAKVLGTAYHCARLEPDQFPLRFVRMLDVRDFEGVEGFIAGGTAYGEALGKIEGPDGKTLTKKKAGESVADQAKRLADAGYPGPIWDVELAAWEAEKGDRVAIPAVHWDEILQDMDRIARSEEVHALLTNGFPEVAILWTCPQSGLPMKTRLDWLRADGWVDFKTFSNQNGKPVRQAITDAFRYNRHHVQAAIQRDGIEAIHAQQLQVFGDPTEAQLGLIATIQMAAPDMACHFVYQEKGGIPNLWARKLRFMDMPLDVAAQRVVAADELQPEIEAKRRQPTAWFTRARREVAAAKRDFMLYSQVYPAGEPWMPFDPVGELTDMDFGQTWLTGE